MYIRVAARSAESQIFMLKYRTYAHSTFSWRSWRLKPWGHTLREGGMGFAHATQTINQDFWQLLRKS